MKKGMVFVLAAAMMLAFSHVSYAGEGTPATLVAQPQSSGAQAMPYKVYTKEELAVVERISAEEVLKLQKQGVPMTIVDLRSPTSYKGSTIKIKNDVRIVYTEMGNKLSLLPFDKRTLIVAYCT